MSLWSFINLIIVFITDVFVFSQKEFIQIFLFFIRILINLLILNFLFKINGTIVFVLLPEEGFEGSFKNWQDFNIRNL